MDNGSSISMNITRPVYQLDDLNRQLAYRKPRITAWEQIRSKTTCSNFATCVLNAIPVVKWLPRYKWKKHLFSDFTSGLSVAVMHIPQGMGYAILGNVPPIFGIYMAIIPVLIYFIFGTSRHISIGTFAVVCLMTGNVVAKHSTISVLQNGTILRTDLGISNNITEDQDVSNIDVAVTVTFTVAIIQMLMYITRMGFISALMSDTLVSGFTCAAAFHVIASQLRDYLGLPIRKERGYFALPKTVYAAIYSLPDANVYSCLISLITSIVLVLHNELFRSWLAKRTTLQCPIELVVVVIGSLIGRYWHFKQTLGIPLVDSIPVGLPEITIPKFDVMPQVIGDSITIAVTSYVISMSMAMILTRNEYEIDSNQEFLALGLSNVVGSFFSALPVCASLSRSMVQRTTGGVTQMASVVSCALLILVLLWIGPFFETLPRCMLASVILIALKGMLLNISSVPMHWKLSKIDALVWIGTFVVTCCVDISVGLVAGIALSIFSLTIRNCRPYICRLGNVIDTDLYLDTNRYDNVLEMHPIKIFHFAGPLNFVTTFDFKNYLKKEKCWPDNFINVKSADTVHQQHTGRLNRPTNMTNLTPTKESERILFTSQSCIIMDMSALTSIDMAGVLFLHTMQTKYTELSIEFLLAAVSGPVFEMIQKYDDGKECKTKWCMFPTVHDAVLYFRNKSIT